ncbi:MAG: prephenate dehydrogenase/arogenate dehydrogenase family protein [Cellulosilyticaceae bacterium]
MRIGIIGFGLIGGSIAKALKKNNAQHSTIVGYDKDTASLTQAFNEGIIDHIATNITTDFSDCNVIFIGTPVSSIPSIVGELMPYVGKDCIITDIGSTKRDIVEQVGKLIHESSHSIYFLGGHPMVGSEKSGYNHAVAHLFENAYYILTPTSDTPDFIVFILQKLIERLGAIPLILAPSYHDFATATVSHLPHIIASSLVHLVKENDGQSNYLHTLAAGGFKDITRIASSHPEIWQSICLSNKGQIQKTFGKFLEILQRFNEALSADDERELYNFFESARTYRDTFQDGVSSSLTQSHTLYVDAQDQPGIIASIATILSTRGINIKDIGIINHREFDCGVLRISLDSRVALLEAHQILSHHNYTIYR